MYGRAINVVMRLTMDISLPEVCLAQTNDPRKYRVVAQTTKLDHGVTNFGFETFPATPTCCPW